MTYSIRSLSISIFLALAITACASSAPEGPVVVTRERPLELPQIEVVPPTQSVERRDRDRDRDRFVTPLHMQGEEPVRVGLLLPFSAQSEAAQSIASAMFDAAQLAGFEAGDDRFLIIPKDTRGTAEGATAAARAALADGAEILLGPLYGAAVKAAADIAQAADVPMIAFTSDNDLAREGVFLLSYPPEAEIERITEYAVANGMTRFGLMAPATRYGKRVVTSFNDEVFNRGGTLVHQELYDQDVDAMREPAKRLAQYSMDVVPFELRHEYDPDAEPLGDDQGYLRGYQAVLVPERGTLLRALAPLFPYYNVNIQKVKLLGVSSWNNPLLTREPALQGGWFAGPDPTITSVFEEKFEATFGEKPPRLASLAYDATLLTARLAQEPRRNVRFNLGAITDPNGYFGADGLFRLRPDGSVERGLAILEIQPGGIQVIDPAPRSFGPFF